MKAVLLTDSADRHAALRRRARPGCRAGDVVVDIHAASVNAADYKMRLARAGMI